MTSSTPRKRKQLATPTPAPTSPVSSPTPTPTSPNGRVFTDSDEICLLRTYKKLNEQNPSPSSTLDSEAIDRINSSLGSIFNRSQITDKIRRLRIKYRKQARSKSLIRSPHDKSLFKVAQLIWGQKTSVNEDEEEEEEEQEHAEVDLGKYPVLVGEFSKYVPMSFVWREALKSLGNKRLKEMNDKWVMIGIEEAKMVTKKVDLVKEQTQLVMEALGDASYC